jgi:hypothetical protein
MSKRQAELQAALEAILAEPYGCCFCDSGKLRNSDKQHDPACGFAMARKALAICEVCDGSGQVSSKDPNRDKAWMIPCPECRSRRRREGLLSELNRNRHDCAR